MKAALMDTLANDPYHPVCPTEADQLRQAKKSGTETLIGRTVSYWRRLSGSLQPRGKTHDSSDQAFDSDTPPPLVELLAKLKRDTEESLEHKIDDVSISFPGFFTEKQIGVLNDAMRELSLRDGGCHGDGKSSVAAMVARREAEFGTFEGSNSSLDCVYGPFGLENVVHIENTESALIVTPFELYVGEESSWAQQGFRAPTYLMKDWLPDDVHEASDKHGVQKTLGATTNSQDAFWEYARDCLSRIFAAEDNSAIDTVYRLLITGTQAHDPHIMQILRELPSIQDFLPSSSQTPVAIRVHRDEAEITRKYIARRQGLLCLLTDYQADWGLWEDYGNELSDSIREQLGHDGPSRNFDVEINPVFAAARGAALRGLESRLLPCHRDCNMTDCPERRPLAGENDWVYERSWRERRMGMEV